MLDKSELLTRKLLNLIEHGKQVTLVIFTLVLVSCSNEGQADAPQALTRTELENADKVLEYRSQLSKTNLRQSETLYKSALNHRDPGSSVKLLLESSLLYPRSVAYLKVVEFQLKQYHYKDYAIKLKILQVAINNTKVALKLNELDELLSDQEISQLNNNQTCISHYLETKKSDSDCEALKWIKIK